MFSTKIESNKIHNKELNKKKKNYCTFHGSSHKRTNKNKNSDVAHFSPSDLRGQSCGVLFSPHFLLGTIIFQPHGKS